MPQLPGVARKAGEEARLAVERARGRRRSAPPPRISLIARLRDRLASGDWLRLRGRFRGRRSLLAFLAVMGPGLIAGIAGNDAGGITTYSILGASTGLALLWLFPITL